MKRGDIYSGARWAFSDRSSKDRPQSRGGGMSIMGGSNMKPEVHYDNECDCGCEGCNYTPCICHVPASELGEGR